MLYNNSVNDKGEIISSRYEIVSLSSAISETMKKLGPDFERNKLFFYIKVAIIFVSLFYLASLNDSLAGHTRQYLYHVMFGEPRIYLWLAGRAVFLIYSPIVLIGFLIQYFLIANIIDIISGPFFNENSEFPIVLYFRHLKSNIINITHSKGWVNFIRCLIWSLALVFLIAEWYYFTGPVSGYTEAGHWRIYLSKEQPIYQHILIFIFLYATSFYMQFLAIIDLIHWTLCKTKLYQPIQS